MIGWVIGSLKARNPYVPSSFLTIATVVCSNRAKDLASPLILSRSPLNFLCSHAQLISIRSVPTIGEELPDVGNDEVIIEIFYGRGTKSKYLLPIFANDIRGISFPSHID